jgi:ABC-type multidrug transport system permease subunit
VNSSTDTTSTRWSLWFTFLCGPFAWTAHEFLSYALVRPACSYGVLILEYIVTLAALATVGGGLYLALRIHHGTFTDPPTTPHFLAIAAIVLNVLFGYAIVMEAIPNLVVSPCL